MGAPADTSDRRLTVLDGSTFFISDRAGDVRNPFLPQRLRGTGLTGVPFRGAAWTHEERDLHD